MFVDREKSRLNEEWAGDMQSHSAHTNLSAVVFSNGSRQFERKYALDDELATRPHLRSFSSNL